MRFKEGKHYAVAEDGCWLWLKSTRDGYGKCYSNGATYSAHRLQYEEYFGPITEGMFILHSCDTRRCINPSHLREGSHSENMQDMTSRKRGPNLQLSEDEISFIQYYLSTGKTQQQVADMLGVSVRTIVRYAKQLNNN